jgi:NAD(P)-dependent dehydrogenase (short-subunit alcohol dehydrogenase family)
MILKNKNAIIYGAGGSLGSAVAKALAAAGANIFLTGKHMKNVKKVASDIGALGGSLQVAQVDALDASSIHHHIDSLVKEGHSIDIMFNAVGYQVVQDVPLVEMNVEDFIHPVNIAMRTQFLTATAVAKVMMKQKSGVILSLTATPGGIGYPYTGGFSVACTGMECFSRNLAAEVGVYGIRVVNIRSGGSPDSRIFKEAAESVPDVMRDVLEKMEGDTMLKKLPLMQDIANVAVFLASDLAAKITGVTIDVTAGTTAGLNYRVEKV